MEPTAAIYVFIYLMMETSIQADCCEICLIYLVVKLYPTNCQTCHYSGRPYHSRIMMSSQETMFAYIGYLKM